MKTRTEAQQARAEQIESLARRLQQTLTEQPQDVRVCMGALFMLIEVGLNSMRKNGDAGGYNGTLAWLETLIEREHAKDKAPD
jgi:hypothetical protein